MALIEHTNGAHAPALSEACAMDEMIERFARDPAIDLDRLERLITMRDRMIERDARIAFDGAFARMQCDLPAIEKRGRIDIGRGKPQAYALWEDINEAIKPVLARHGFALQFREAQPDGKVSVTAILAHVDGHRDETSVTLPYDASGSKNAVQSIGSSMSYAKRYAAMALLNITARGEDDDGRGGAGGTVVTDEQAAEISRLVTATKSNIELFLKWAGAPSIPDIPATKYQACVTALNNKMRGRK